MKSGLVAAPRNEERTARKLFRLASCWTQSGAAVVALGKVKNPNAPLAEQGQSISVPGTTNQYALEKRLIVVNLKFPAGREALPAERMSPFVHQIKTKVPTEAGA